MVCDSDRGGWDVDFDSRCFLAGGFHAGFTYGEPAVGIALLSSCGIELSSMFIQGSGKSGDGIGSGLDGRIGTGEDGPAFALAGSALRMLSGVREGRAHCADSKGFLDSIETPGDFARMIEASPAAVLSFDEVPTRLAVSGTVWRRVRLDLGGLLFSLPIDAANDACMAASGSFGSRIASLIVSSCIEKSSLLCAPVDAVDADFSKVAMRNLRAAFSMIVDVFSAMA
jgi:hypothetical protein